MSMPLGGLQPGGEVHFIQPRGPGGLVKADWKNGLGAGPS